MTIAKCLQNSHLRTLGSRSKQSGLLEQISWLLCRRRESNPWSQLSCKNVYISRICKQRSRLMTISQLEGARNWRSQVTFLRRGGIPFIIPLCTTLEGQEWWTTPPHRRSSQSKDLKLSSAMLMAPQLTCSPSWLSAVWPWWAGNNLIVHFYPSHSQHQT